MRRGGDGWDAASRGSSGRLDVDPLAEPTHTAPDHGLPAEPGASDVDAVRFDTAPRGYRMDEVDALIGRLSADLAAREADLREAGRSTDAGTPTADAPIDPPPADDAREPDEADEADEADKVGASPEVVHEQTTELATEPAPDQGSARHRGTTTTAADNTKA